MITPIILSSSANFYQNNLPHISIDCVIFGYKNGALQILLVQVDVDGDWFLPGGYIGKEEDLDIAAVRILKERSGAERIFLQQFGAFGNANRTKGNFDEYSEDLWYKQRFLTIAYYGLVDIDAVTLAHDDYSNDVRWFPIHHLPKLALDHKSIFDLAFQSLKEQINFRPIGLNLLPKEFTIPELQGLYEAILGHKLNRGNFYKKMMKFNVLTDLHKVKDGVSYRAPKLYCFNLEEYHKTLNDLFW